MKIYILKNDSLPLEETSCIRLIESYKDIQNPILEISCTKKKRPVSKRQAAKRYYTYAS
ncbi:hypothetical protein BD749_1250 [Pontibacter ramchanderi]|uniref:Uncharacterized protein n=1 Tax=Pontibacter ramchanderi TaxID=1179743 RepID=A0A2N3V3U8_9BACT|nr:hypothetical protein BD749_1250 [Pontibacter ramchanderi]